MAQRAEALAVVLLHDVRARVATIVCELELDETQVAYQVAVDLEHDLDEALPRLEEAA